MSELEKLKKENKQLKALLKNAVQLLNRYKGVIERAALQRPKRKAVKKSSIKKPRS